jgi:hypothetical protein
LIIRKSTKKKKKRKKKGDECICEEREEHYDDYFPDIRVDEKTVEIYREIMDWKEQ